MIAVDDLNNWTSALNGYGSTVYTPNVQRISDQGLTFSSAFSAVPLCNPSRTAIMSGQSPLTTGVYLNGQGQFPAVDINHALPLVLQSAGYVTATTGKVFGEETSVLYQHNLGPTGLPAERDPANLVPVADTQNVNYYIGDPSKLSDAEIAQNAVDFLNNYSAASGNLFLSVGFHRPHGPWNVPKEYFDLYPLDQIQLPQTPPGDLADLPPLALQLTTQRAFDRTVAAGEWAKFVQGYLASVTFTDAMVGKVLDALQSSAIANDTMIVLWSDHGYHLGDKDTFHKFTLWEPAARSQLIIMDPTGTAGAGTVTDETVSTLDIYSTVLDYAGVAQPAWAEGQSLRHFVSTGDASGLSGTAVTFIHGSYSIRTNEYRYTRYEDGGEELYHVSADPMDIVNLSADPGHAALKAAMAAQLDAYLADHHVQINTTAVSTTLVGSSADDNLIAGYGADTLIGGAGNDVYLVRPGTWVVEAANGGHDTALTRGSYTLPDNIENLECDRFDKTLIIRTPYTLGGNAQDNFIKAAGSRVDMSGDAGNDTLSGIFTTGTFDGGDGADSIVAGTRDDLLSGGAGNDLLRDFGGNNTLNGGDGNDTLYATSSTGNDMYRLSAGADVIQDMGGVNGLDVSAWGLADTAFSTVTNALGQVTYYAISHVGTTDRTWMAAGPGGARPFDMVQDGTTTTLLQAVSYIGSRLGDDDVIGSGGNDTIDGRGGNDSLDGGDGNDLITAGQGSDTVRGGAGNDTITLGLMQRDEAYGDAGDDRFVVGAGISKGSIAGGIGADTLAATEADLRWLGLTTLETLQFAGTVQLTSAQLAASGIATAVGSAGAALVLNGRALAPHALAVLGDGVAVTGNLANDTLLGGDGAQTLAGNDGADSLSGGAGNDSLVGGAGADTLAGGDGNDTLLMETLQQDSGDAGAGDDLVLVAGGHGTVHGGLGTDTLSASGSLAFVSFDGFEQLWLNGAVGVTAAQLTAAELLGFTGSAGSSLAIAGRATGLHGLTVAGDGVAVFGSLSNDTLLGQDGTQSLAGGDGTDSLSGGAGDDSLVGGAGADTLAGGDGNDTLLGGAGRDTLTGGTGADAFRLQGPGDAADQIADFASGQDSIELSAAGFGGGLVVGMDLYASGWLVLSNLPSAAYGQFLFTVGNGRLYWDADGTGAAASILVATIVGPLAPADLHVIG